MRPLRVAVVALGAIAIWGCSSANYPSSSPSASPSLSGMEKCANGVWWPDLGVCATGARSLVVQQP